MHYIDASKTYREKARRKLGKNATSYIKQIMQAIPPQSNSCTATYLPSLKPSKLDGQDTQNTAGEASTNS